jgi:putative transposase
MEEEILTQKEKNRQIAKTLKATKVRHESMACKTYELKVDRSHSNTATLDHLNRLFLEAKWLYNSVVGLGNLFEEADWKQKKVLVKNKDGLFEERELRCLSAQMRQEIISRAKDNIHGLSTLKARDHAVGRLGFKSRIFSIPLIQYGRTHRILGNHVEIQNVKQPLVVHGLGQIPTERGTEPTSATLIQRNGDFFIHLSVYQPRIEKVFPKKAIGIDFGIKSQLTLSIGLRIQEGVFPTKRLRRLHRELSKRAKVHGKNWTKTNLKLNREYQKLSNRRADIRHKIVSRITSTYESVAFQDDPIRGWMVMWGRKVQASAIGGIMSDLKTKSHTLTVVPRFKANTALCFKCGHINEIDLDTRIMTCDACGLVADRDLMGATNDWLQIPAGRREYTPRDTKTATEMMVYLNDIPNVSASQVEELGSHPIPNRW